MQKTLEKDTTRQVDLALIDEPEGRIRMKITAGEIESLVDNIKEVGQLQAILLVKKGKRYEIAAGHRRFLAMKELGKKTIRAEMKVMDRKEVAIVRASENLMRKNLSPIEEGAVYVDLQIEHKMTAKAIADKFGMPPSSVQDKMALTQLEPEIQIAIHEGKIYINVGMELDKIDHNRERKKHLQYAIDNGCSLETAKGWVKEYQRSETSEEPSTLGSGSPLELPQTQKIYQACELCENPVEIQEMKIIRICPGCYKVIAENLKQGGV